MSLLKSIGKGLKGAAKAVGAVGKIPILGSLVKTLPGVGTVVAGAELIGAGVKAAKASGMIGGGPPPIAPPPYYDITQPQQMGIAGTLVKTLPPGTLGKIGRGVGVAVGAAGAAEIARRMFSDSPRKRRSMNVFNAKALNRAHRRIEGFSDTSRKVLREIGISVSQTRRPPIRKRG